jgi:hypothetical protein
VRAAFLIVVVTERFGAVIAKDATHPKDKSIDALSARLSAMET